MNSERYELVIIADDFGLSRSVSEAIIVLLNSGVVSATSTMMCEPLANVMLAANRETLLGRCGVHLQAIKSRPRLAHNQVNSLTDENGLFHSIWDPSRYELSELQAEWFAQIESFLSLGLDFTHIDSHHNIHLSDPVLEEFSYKLGKHYEVRVRRTAKKLFLQRDSKHDCDICLNSWTLSGMSASRLVQELEELILAEPNIRRIEIITHPGFVDETLAKISSQTYSREFEFEELMKLPKLLDESKFAIKNYRPDG